MDNPIHIDTIRMDLSVLYFLRVCGHSFHVFLSLKIVLSKANSAYPDEMPPYALFVKVPVYQYPE